jgi:hypothetical protein
MTIKRERYGCQSIVWCFVKIENHTTMTGELNASVNTLKGIKFGRVERLGL